MLGSACGAGTVWPDFISLNDTRHKATRFRGAMYSAKGDLPTDKHGESDFKLVVEDRNIRQPQI